MTRGVLVLWELQADLTALALNQLVLGIFHHAIAESQSGGLLSSELTWFQRYLFFSTFKAYISLLGGTVSNRSQQNSPQAL